MPEPCLCLLANSRAKLRKILADPRVSGIVVERRDRRARFGVEHLAAARTGRRIIVVNPDIVVNPGWGER
jgi:putative resolvase